MACRGSNLFRQLPSILGCPEGPPENGVGTVGVEEPFRWTDQDELVPSRTGSSKTDNRRLRPCVSQGFHILPDGCRGWSILLVGWMAYRLEGRNVLATTRLARGRFHRRGRDRTSRSKEPPSRTRDAHAIRSYHRVRPATRPTTRRRIGPPSSSRARGGEAFASSSVPWTNLASLSRLVSSAPRARRNERAAA